MTWHDEDNDVVWLLGTGWHESGSRVDARAVLKRRDVAGALMPNEADYSDLEMSYEQAFLFVNQIAEQVPVLVGRARQQPGKEVGGVLASRFTLRLLINIVVIASDDEYRGRLVLSTGHHVHVSRGFEQRPVEQLASENGIGVTAHECRQLGMEMAD